MATFQVTGPDGARYRVTAPDGASDADVMTVLSSQVDTSTAAPSAGETKAVDQIDFSGPDLAVNSQIGLLPDDERLEGLTRQQVVKQRAARKRLEDAPWYAEPARALQGAIDASGNIARGTFVGSWLDEATGKLAGAIPGGETEEQAIARVRAQNRIQDEDLPITSTVAKLLGAVTTGGPALQWAMRAPSGLGAVGRGATVGAAHGGFYGLGEGEGDFDDRLDEAETGAKLGATFGAGVPLVTNVAAPAAVRMAAPVVDRARDLLDGMRSGASAERAADRILSRRIAQSGTTPEALADDVVRSGTQDLRLASNSYLGRTELDDGTVVGNINEALADQTPGLQRFAGAVGRTGGRAREIVEGTLERRQRGPRNPFAEAPAAGDLPGQFAQLEDALSRSLVIRGQSSAHRTSREIQEQMRRDGRELYREAYENSQQFNIRDTLEAFRARIDDEMPPAVARVYNRAADLFTRTTPDGARVTVSDVRRFDASKKALDDAIEAAQRTGENNRARLLTELKNDLLDDVHAGGANESYRRARAAWGSEAERREAIDLGRLALNADSETTVETFRALSEGNQQLFRIGLRSALRNAQRTRKSGDNAALLFGQQRVQQLLGEAIPRSRASGGVFRNRPERFGEILRRINRMSQTRQLATKGSQTAANLQDDAMLAGDMFEEMAQRARTAPSFAGMMVEMVTALGRRAFGFREDVAEALARRLMETSPQARLQILADIAEASRPGQFQRFVEGLRRRGVRIGLGTGRVAASGEGDAP